MIRIRAYESADEDAVVALWEAAGIARPWLDLRAEIHAKLRRDPELFLVAVDDHDVEPSSRRGACPHAPSEPTRGVGTSPTPTETTGNHVEPAETIVGSLMGAYDGRRGWIHHLAVAPDRQRLGIGRALMTEVEVAMARIGVEKINLQVRTGNLGVIGFYEKLGYGDDHVIGMGKWINRKQS